jgi:CRP-like cAMP-binding protein
MDKANLNLERKTMLNVHELDQVPQLKGLSSGELKQLAQIMDKRDYPKGETIFSKDQPANHFYLLIQGKVKIEEITSQKSPETSNALGPGAYLGDFSSSAKATYPNTIQALTDCKLLVFDKAGFNQLSTGNPGCGLKIIKSITINLCRRSRKLDERYTDMVDYMIDGEHYDSRHRMSTAEKGPGAAVAKALTPVTEHELEGIPLLAELTTNEKKKIAPIIGSGNYLAQEHIFAEHTRGGELYIVRAGAVKISKMIQQGKVLTLSILKEGKFFGVLSLLEEEEHTATVEAVKESQIFVINKLAFEEFMQQQPACGLKIMRHICQDVHRLLSKIEQDFDFTSKYVWESGPFYL